MLVVGIDVGSRTTKVAVTEGDEILQLCLSDSRIEIDKATRALVRKCLTKANRKKEKVYGMVSTGYGRNAITFASSQVSEITCHATAVHHFLPNVRTVIDIGGQDSKGIKINEKGKITDFVMNEKCAAGTGRFIEVMARALKIRIEEMGPLSFQATEKAKVSSTCTVFAESQVIANIARGVSKANLIAGILDAIAERVTGMVSRLKIETPVAITGGGALNPGLVTALEGKLNVQLLTPPHPQFCGAIGAALVVVRSR